MDKKSVKNAWIELLCREEFDWFGTLNFNRATSHLPARKKLEGWLARLDHQHLGVNWSRWDPTERTFAIAVTEHPDTNFHLHVLLRLAKPGRLRKRADQMESRIEDWRDFVP